MPSESAEAQQAKLSENLFNLERGPLANSSTQKTAEAIARAIIQEICDNKLEEGDPLQLETNMMAQYQAGRASVREALRLLEIQGLVTLKPGRSGGAFVGSADANHLGRMFTLFLQMIGATYNDVADFILALGPKTAELAALNPDRELVARSLKCALETDRCAYVVSPDVHADEILDFHRAINMLTGNPALAIMMDTVESIIMNHIIHRTPSEDRMPWIHADHEEIAEAILAGDARRAHELHYQHLKHANSYYRELNHGKFTSTVQWS